MIDLRAIFALGLLVALAACTGEDDGKTVDSADGAVEQPRRKGPPYQVAPVTASGTITGTVTMPAPVAPTAGAQAAGTPAAGGRCAGYRADGDQPAVVYLENIERGRALRADTPRRHELAAGPCELSPRVSVVAAGGTLNLSNALNAVHRVSFTFEGMKNPMLRVPFSDPGQLVPTTRVLAVPGVIDVASDQAPSVRARIVVVDHPYAVATTDGRFTLDSVPPGNYSLVAVTAAGRAAATIAVQAGATTTAVLTVQ